MKKMRNYKDVQAEKERLQQQQLQLEQEMKQEWSGLKDSLRPANLAGEAMAKLFSSSGTSANSEGTTSVKSALSYGLISVARKLVEQAVERFRQQKNSSE
jgi:hypothetical protein